MTTTHQAPIVVGVDGTAGSRAGRSRPGTSGIRTISDWGDDDERTDRWTAGADAGRGHGRVRGELLGLGPAEPAGPQVQGRAAVEPVPAGAAGGGAGRRRFAGPHPDRRPDRPVRLAGD